MFQRDFRIRCEWGREGAERLAAMSDVVVVVDVLSFTTAVDVATARGASILPYPRRDDSAEGYAAAHHAQLAPAKRGSGFTLSPASLVNIPAGYRLALPSPNGGAISYGLTHPVVFAGCLRNTSSVARRVVRLGGTVAVIPAGERWPGGEPRPAFEDWIGAGAVIAELEGSRSPEAELAEAAFLRFRGRLLEVLRASTSGAELISWGFERDVEIAAEFNASGSVARLADCAFVAD